jgi:transposase
MKKTGKRYSEVFKRQVVRDIEQGRTSARAAAKQYGITGTMTIPKWLQRYGSGCVVGRASKPERADDSRKLAILERRNRELEQAVARLTVEKVALEAVVEEAQSHFGVDLKKTFGTGR